MQTLSKNNLYTLESVENLTERYLAKRGGRYVLLQEGALLDGLSILTAPGYKTVIIKEVYLNAWSSAYSVRMYNKVPAKYAVMLEKAVY